MILCRSQSCIFGNSSSIQSVGTALLRHVGLASQAAARQQLHCAAGAIWELHDLAGKARGHKANCLLLDSFLQDVMRTLDNQGRALAQLDSLQLAHLLELIESAIELVDGCNKAGATPVCVSRQLFCTSTSLRARVMSYGCCSCRCC